MDRPSDAAEGAQWPVANDIAITIARVCILGLGLLLLLRGISEPFSGWFEWNSAWFAHFARNHLQYGLEYTQLYCTDGLTALPPEMPAHYLSHPPLLCGWVALPMALLGDHEWVARSVPILFTLGSAWVLMTIVARLHSVATSLLAGLIFVTLPLTAYFGRLLDFTAVVQLFSLLMLLGYLEWSGADGSAPRPRRGTVLYSTAAVLGVGTDWAALLMVAPLCVWHWARLRDLRIAPWMWLAPGVAGLVTVLHILAAVDWDVGFFVDLVATRTAGLRPEGPQPWSQWVVIQGRFLVANFTWPGIAAALAFPFVLRAAGLGFSPPLRRARASSWACVAFQGASYVVLFKNQSWIHDYWQYYLAPCVAVSLASGVAALHSAVAARLPRRVALAVPIVCIAALLPGFYQSWSRYHSLEHIPREYLDVFVELEQRIPPKAPVMTSRNWEVYKLSFGSYDRFYMQPQIAYHANRPLIHTVDPAVILANESGSAAFVLEAIEGTDWQALRDLLSDRYETFPVGRLHLVALLDRPKASPATAP